MRRLFWKLFFSFWVALLVFSGASIYIASHYLDRVQKEELSLTSFERLTRYRNEAQGLADKHGVEGLREWIRTYDHETVLPIMMVDSSGRDVLGRDVSDRIQIRLHRHMRLRAEHPTDYLGYMRPIVIPDGTLYWLIPDYQGTTFARLLSQPGVVILSVLIAVLVGGLMSLWFVRYLTKPLDKMRSATEAYAEGNLDVRVAPLLGRRRDEITDLALAFDRMAERLSHSIASHKHLRDVSHELRSPLARLQVALALALRQEGKDVEPALNRIEREAERLNEMIGQLLILSRYEAGIFPEFAPVDLAALMEDVVSESVIEAEAKPCALVLRRNEHVTVVANAELLHSVLENVIRNAIRYTAPGTEVTVESAPAADDASMWEVRVGDRGPGVAEEMLGRIFEPFVRVADARDRASGGVGLGLSIAERAARLHGGRIVATNRPNGGLAVSMRMPIAGEGAPAWERSIAPAAARGDAVPVAARVPTPSSAT